MGTRTFKKPEIKNTALEVSEGVLSKLNEKIFSAQKEWEAFQQTITDERAALEEGYRREKSQKVAEIAELESVLIFKREERTRLETPLIVREKALNEREDGLNERENILSEGEQSLFEKERSYEAKLEGIKDLADEIGEARIKNNLRDKLLDSRDNQLKDREAQYLVKIREFEQARTYTISMLQNREDAVSFRELQVAGKEENISKREKDVLNGFVLLNDRRDTLARAWKELEKKHGSRTKR